MPRILSVQSHVAYGYVGGKAAVFPLQLLGYDVDVVNSVNYSNHSAYRRIGGTKTTADDLNRLFATMAQNELLSPDRLLTGTRLPIYLDLDSSSVGYIPGAGPLNAVADLARKLRAQNPNLVYLLDPVMGDAGLLYVASDVIPVYRSMLPFATIITPNWFEVETLTQVSLVDFPSLKRALGILHIDYQVPNVVISSLPLYPWLIPFLPPATKPSNLSKPHLICIASQATGNSNSSHVSNISAACVPRIPSYFSGVGDLFSALLLGHYRLPMSNGNAIINSEVDTKASANPLQSAASSALSITHAVLSFTHARALSLPEDERPPTDDELDAAEPLRVTRRMRGRELALVQARHLITDADAVLRYELQPWADFWA
ncbi:hypothetical protein AX14_007694 [Amanita brunnescens Koide BX004]|nr:hypothetical protein AX14_007694 [Amanita brunnescens Koide BX004]